jgi:hypothetical protein
MAEKVAESKIQLLKSQRDKAQRSMDGLDKQVDFGKISQSEAKRRRGIYTRVIARSDRILNSPTKKETSPSGIAGIFRKIVQMSPWGTDRKLKGVEKKAGG